jgi:hypothetical protein
MTPLTPASAEVADLAARHRLGVLQGVFAPKRLRRALFAVHVFNCLMSCRSSWSPDCCTTRFACAASPTSAGSLQQEIIQLIINGHPAPTRHVFSASAPGQGLVRITEFYEDPDV